MVRPISLVVALALPACGYDFDAPFDGGGAAGHSSLATGGGGMTGSGGDSGSGGQAGPGGAGGSGGSLTAYQTVVHQDDPLSYWRFGEAAGPSAEDEFGAMPCSYGGGAQLGVPGAIASEADTAVAFDGTGYVLCSTRPASDPGESFAVEIWIALDETPTAAGVRIASHRNDVTPYDGWRLHVTSARDIVFDQWSQAPNSTSPTATLETAFPNDTAWHHVVVSGDGSLLTLYLDGVKEATATEATYPADPADASFAWAAQANLANAFLVGRLDEAALYGAPLLAGRVKLHYDTGKAP